LFRRKKNRPARFADLEKVSQLLKNTLTSLEYNNILAKETEMKKNTLGKLLLENFETSKKRVHKRYGVIGGLQTSLQRICLEKLDSEKLSK
jgi:hypothetical protein